MGFQLVSGFVPQGDQPAAISALVKGLASGKDSQVLLGVTGSGKTFTIAHVIQNTQRPTLVIAPNKTLTAQLYSEFKDLFPQNAVEYFVSYYDYYQPEAYIPASDTYIEKDSSINELIDKMRHSATRSLLSRRDVIVVASVSCIFGLGSPADYKEMCLTITTGGTLSRDETIKRLVSMQYERNSLDFYRGSFRVRGERVDIFPSYEDKRAVRIELFGDTVDKILEIDPLTGKAIQHLQNVVIHPASHYVTTGVTLKNACKSIRHELKDRTNSFLAGQKLIEAQRIEERTNFDLEMMRELGYCQGIENYSRHLTGRKPGEPPPTLFDYFPEDFLMIVDESHITIPQLMGMYRGDRARKESLIGYGFRLPSALDNRPLTFEEFEKREKQVIYVSATPGEYEINKAKGEVVEQIIRPTGLPDPRVIIRPAENQVEDLLDEIRKRVKKKERVLATTLTKRMSEDLCDYYAGRGIRVRYLHSEVATLERVEIIRDLRLGEFDVLIGINLLREGLDIPEVSLVAILDADKEGFLRSSRSIIQICGRAARNVSGTAILYADKMTKSIEFAKAESERRRCIQEEYNREKGITPATIRKNIHSILDSISEADYVDIPKIAELDLSHDDIPCTIEQFEKEMKKAAKSLEFEKAAGLRDRILELKKVELELR
ncbi:MAG: excinuclease ABC subunit UvrB [Pseudomonadota bacterium]